MSQGGPGEGKTSIESVAAMLCLSECQSVGAADRFAVAVSMPRLAMVDDLPSASSAIGHVRARILTLEAECRDVGHD